MIINSRCNKYNILKYDEFRSAHDFTQTQLMHNFQFLNYLLMVSTQLLGEGGGRISTSIIPERSNVSVRNIH